MKTLIVGTAGHVDHGKSSLLRALSSSGETLDRLPEEKRRGITLELGFSVLKTEEKTVFFVDVPGHEALVRGMITGVCGFGAALLAVDATEGIMPQTREHACILKICGVKNIIVALTKCDKVSASAAEKMSLEVQSFLKDFGLPPCVVLMTSIYNKESIAALREVILTTEVPPVTSNIFRMNIDRAFTINGFGTVVTGSVLSGKVSEDDEVSLWPLNKTVRVKRIETVGERMGTVCAGMRVGLNLSGVSVKDVGRGSVVYTPGVYEEASSFRAELCYFSGKEAALKDNKIYNIFIGTGKHRGRLLMKSGRIVLERPFPAEDGEVFFIRGGSPEMTLAGGRLYKEENKKREVKKYLKNNQPINETPAYAEEAERAITTSEKPITEEGIAKALNISVSEIKTALKYLSNREKIVSLGNAFISKSLFLSLTEAVKKIITEDGSINIASAKQATGLSRDHCIALLDKGDRLSLWRNKNGTRY